jgi:flagellar biosynthetic protein FlhB
MSEEDSDDKTQEATPERRRQARENGQFARARDTGAMAATFGVLLALQGFGGDFAGHIRNLALRCFGDTPALAGDGIALIGREAALALVAVVGPVLAAACIFAVAAGFWEAGFEPRLELAAPKWERLDPIPKLGQLFSPKQGFANVALSLGRVAVVGLVAYLVIDRELPRLERLSTVRLTDSAPVVLAVLAKLALWSTLALAVLTAVDYGTSWFRHEKSIRMSLEEMKREHQQQEGDPRLKSKQRQRAREMAKRGLRKQVLEADVIIANPTHISIALRYRPAQGAPVVLAKGFDEVALYMRKVATEGGVPVVENRPLARALSNVRNGRVIPVELYATVAEVLAFVYRMKNRGRRA